MRELRQLPNEAKLSNEIKEFAIWLRRKKPIFRLSKPGLPVLLMAPHSA
jgi:hypothetical protein